MGGADSHMDTARVKNKDYSVRFIGYASGDRQYIYDKIVEGDINGLKDIPGNYTVVIENENECYIATSPYGLCQYYYTFRENRLFHDDTVIGVLQKSGLKWSWNYRALADMTQLDHVLENDTLHDDVHRVPGATILSFKDSGMRCVSLGWEDLHPRMKTDAYACLGVFNDEMRRWVGDKTVVSMSGGFDSRLILSSLLKDGRKPLLLTMGFDNSTDVVIARQIAETFDLPMLVVKVPPEDLITYGDTIAGLTNGTKTAWNWHTYVYLKRSGIDPDSTVFIGTNGEFSKNEYLDMGIAAEAADLLPGITLRMLWKKSLKFIFKNTEADKLCEGFSRQFSNKGRELRFERLARLCHKKLLKGLNIFFLEQRVRIFHGNGFKLCSANFASRVPFMSRSWVSNMWNLDNRWKFGSNWHRFVIAKNLPILLNFPDVRLKMRKTYPKAPPLYWLVKRNEVPIIDYADYPRWFQDRMFVQVIADNRKILSELIDPSAVSAIIEEHGKYANRTAAMSFLMTMVFWLNKLKSSGVR